MRPGINTVAVIGALLPLAAAALAAAAPVAAAAAARPPVRCHGHVATIVGTARDDVIRGTDGPDVIAALGGRDRVDGRGGDDIICGGDGNDVLSGGRGDDRLYGELAGLKSDRGGTRLDPNLLIGGAGDDYLDAGDDPRRTDEGGNWGIITYRDAHHGVHVDLGSGRLGTVTGRGQDTVRVRSAVIYEGSRFDDVLLGSPHADFLVGGTGDDELHGGDGNDVLETEADNLHGPADDDVAYGDAGQDDIVTWKGSDVVHGGPGNDDLGTYSPRPTQIYGEDGDDDILGMVTPAPGYVVDGGAGYDTVELDSPEGEPGHGAALTVDAGAGTITRDGVQTGTLVSADELSLDDTFAWTYDGTDGPDVVTGGYDRPFNASTYGGDDVVTGGSKDDFIDAGDGDDTVTGGDGADTCLHAEHVDGCEVLTSP